MSLSLTDDLRQIKGVGPKIETQLNSLNIFTLEDLIFHLPIRYENKTQLNEIKDLDQNQTAHVEGEIVESKIFFPGRRSFLAKIPLCKFFKELLSLEVGKYLSFLIPNIFLAFSKLFNHNKNSSGEVEYAFFLICEVSKATCFSKEDAPKASASGAIFTLLGSS